MHPTLRLLTCALVGVLACGDSGNTTTAATATDSTGPGSTTSTTDAPTTGPGTTTTTGVTTSGSSTGVPGSMCAQHTTEADCGLAGCDWIQVVGYTHGTQGCQGNIRDFCVPTDTSGGSTSVWKDNGGDIDVVQFPFDPTDLGPEWQDCSCDGPLACLCTDAPLDCPERMDEFCGTITGENGCTNAASAGELVCSWFSVSPEGPLDTMCADAAPMDTCLPATGIGAVTCDPITLPYPNCAAWTDPVFWRDNAGVIEITTICGPEPLGWTLCVADDPNQPEECKCRCL